MIRRILIADDEEENRLVIEELFSRRGYQVEKARDGVEALELLFQHPFSLSIFDVNMPRLGGLDALCELRRRGSEIPVVITTSNHTDEIKRRALSSGANGFFYKPLELEPLRFFVKSLIGEETSLTIPITTKITVRIGH